MYAVPRLRGVGRMRETNQGQANEQFCSNAAPGVSVLRPSWCEGPPRHRAALAHLREPLVAGWCSGIERRGSRRRWRRRTCCGEKNGWLVRECVQQGTTTYLGPLRHRPCLMLRRVASWSPFAVPVLPLRWWMAFGGLVWGCEVRRWWWFERRARRATLQTRRRRLAV